MTEPRVLLVEDDETVGAAVVAVLDHARYDVTWRQDGAGALASVEHGVWDLVVLDLGLPDMDGVDLCRTLRSRHPLLVIVVLTARDAEIDVVVGLEAGADDFLVKPVRSVELVARLRAHLRRSGAVPAGQVQDFGALRLDLGSRRAWLGRVELQLRPKHFDLLARLLAQQGGAVTREVLMTDVWDENWFGSTKTLDVHIAGLRRSLAVAAREASVVAPVVTTLRGYGFRLDEGVSAGGGQLTG